MSQVQDRVAGLIEAPLAARGFELVRVQLSGASRPVLQIMAERADRVAMTVEDCAGISRMVSALLDAEDPVAGAYTLEVSSPGIDRPLTRPGDFVRFAGFEARIETREPVAGRRRFRGRLRGLDGALVTLETEDGPAEIDVSLIARARLVLTDDLLEAHKEGTP